MKREKRKKRIMCKRKGEETKAIRKIKLKDKKCKV
jgi:hypothetical protein